MPELSPCLLPVVRALNHLAARLNELGTTQPAAAPSVLLTLRPWPRMLDGVTPRAAPATVLSRVLLAQDHLLAQLDGTLIYDPHLLLLALQQIGDEAQRWSEPAQRLAARLQVELPASPWEWGGVFVRGVDWHLAQQQFRAAKPP